MVWQNGGGPLFAVGTNLYESSPPHCPQCGAKSTPARKGRVGSTPIGGGVRPLDLASGDTDQFPLELMSTDAQLSH